MKPLNRPLRFTSTIAIDDVEQTNQSIKKTLYILRKTYYCSYMIKSFRCRDTATLFDDRRVAHFQAFERQARRKLLYLHRARTLDDLRQPPGNQLEALKGDRQGQYSIRINDQWRICFRWESGDVYDVEIVDYH